MDIASHARYIRISPKKLKMLGRTVVGLAPRDAQERLSFMGSKASRILQKVIQSAVANAVNTKKYQEQTLRVQAVQIQKGPFYKRFMPVSRGMAHQRKKRTSHVLVLLTQQEEKKAAPVVKQEQTERRTRGKKS